MDGRANLHPLVQAFTCGSACSRSCRKGAFNSGQVFLDGTIMRAHQKAAGAAGEGVLKLSEAQVKRLAALVAALEPKLV